MVTFSVFVRLSSERNKGLNTPNRKKVLTAGYLFQSCTIH